MNISLQDVRAAFDGFSSEHMYIGDIPHKIYANVCAGMGIEPRHRGEVLAAYDACAFFNHGDEGFAIVHDGIYIRKMLANRSFKKWDEISSIRKDPDTSGDILIDDAVFFAFAGDDDNVVNCLQRLVEMAKGEDCALVGEKDNDDEVDHRKRMQLYNEISATGLQEKIHLFCVGDEENGQCIGVELSQDGKQGVTVYIAPQDARKANLILNLGEETLDNFVNDVTKHSAVGMEYAYPLFMEALKNGANDYYTSPALVRLADCTEPHKRIWCLVMQLHNVDIAKDFTSDYVTESIGNLLSYVNNMFEQLISNKVSLPDKLRRVMGEGWDGYKIGKIAFNVVSILSAILGGGSIINGSSDS